MKTNEATKLWIAVVFLMAVVTALGVWSGLNWAEQRDKTAVAEETGQVVATEGDELAARVQEACAAGGEAAAALRRQRACAQADRTRETIKEAPVEPETPQALPPRETRYVPVPGPRGLPGTADDGQDGQDGEDGADSTVPGPPGADSTVPGPKGDKGDKGDPGESITGPAGRDGRGVADVACIGGLTPITFTFTFDDGTSQTVTCGQLEPVPEPTE